jgi:AraC family transcriptional regulator of adaptative response/methylated-DNA-[protein]-cysteine methyltransferase
MTRDDEQRWQAVVERDVTADGTFVYGVTTTRVFCRPSCPSRRARRDHVVFHETAADALAAGLRPCRRCEPMGVGTAERRAAIVAEACAAIDAAVAAPTLAELARRVGVSPHHLHRLFTAETGISPKAYAQAVLARRFRDRLDDPSVDITTAIYDAGYASNGRFYESAGDRLGMTPTQRRRGGDGVGVRFALAESSLGAVLVAATDRGVCAVELGDDAEAMLHDFQDRFHAAELEAGDETFELLVAQVVELVEHPDRRHDLPLDVQGTAFQERVWRALRTIPPGSTVSYAEIAERIGSPAAVRAVAGACGANKIAVAIPCHRVIRVDGSLSGYRWGVERKRELLRRERTTTS